MTSAIDQSTNNPSYASSISSNSSLESFLPSDLDLDDYSEGEQRVQRAVAYLKFCKNRGDIKPPSVRTVALQFGAPRSTVGTRLNGIQPKAISNAAKSHFTNAETEVLIDLISVTAERGFPLSLNSLRDTADYILLAKYKGIVDFTTLTGRNTLYDDVDAVEKAPKVGKHWAKRWLNKNGDRVKKYKGRKLDSVRANALNPENVGHWFSLVRDVYVREGEDGVMQPQYLYGMDETCGWFDYDGEVLVLGGRGKKNQYSTRKQNRESATLIVSTCADGTVLKPFCIFSAKTIRKEWVATNPLDARWVHYWLL